MTTLTRLPGRPSFRARRRLEAASEPDVERGILSPHDRRRRPVKVGQVLSHVLLLGGLVVVGLGPLLWLAKAAISTTQDTIQYPL
ncbi:carbohydrate ABC transporter permease, partial [Schumannella luteola]